MNQYDLTAMRASVLVADDAQDFVDAVTRILNHHGYTVHYAPTGRGAVESAQAARPDLILLDIALPDIDGYAVCEALKGDQGTRDVPVIFLSAHHGQLDIVRAFAVGAVDFIAKPFAAEELLARVRVHLSVQQLQRQLQAHVTQLEHEVAERRQAEETLRERELLLRSISDNMPRGYIYQLEYDADGRPRYRYVSGGITATTEITPEQAYTDASLVLDQLLAEDRKRLVEATTTVMAERGVFEFEGQARAPSGALRWMYVRSTPKFLEDGRVVFSGVSLDITARKRAEEALRRRVAELEALNLIAQGLTSWSDVARGVAGIGPILTELFDAGSITVWSHESDSGVLRHLATIGAALEATPAVQKATVSAAILADPAVRVEALPAHSPLVSGRVESVPTGEVRSTILVTLRTHGEPIGLLCVSAARLEQRYLPSDMVLAQTVGGLLASAVENARLFAQAQSAAAERERRRLARELHDSVSQALFAANRAAEALPLIWELDPEEGRERLEELQRFTQSALAEMRALLVELHPRALTEVPLHRSLPPLLEALAAKDGVTVEATIEPAPLLPSEIQVMLYRIAQEALSNVSRHARATQVGLRLTATPPLAVGEPWHGCITLAVEDNGRGFELGQIDHSRMGLLSMRERAADIGAQLEIASEAGAGTRVSVNWYGAASAGSLRGAARPAGE